MGMGQNPVELPSVHIKIAGCYHVGLPVDSVQLVHILLQFHELVYGTYNELYSIHGVYKPTYISWGHHILLMDVHPQTINGNFRILNWRYCTIFLAIFCGDIPLHRPEN